MTHLQNLMIVLLLLWGTLANILGCKPNLTFNFASRDPELNGDIRLDCDVTACGDGYELQWRKYLLRPNGEKDEPINLYYYNSNSDHGAFDRDPDYDINGRTDYGVILGVHTLLLSDLNIKDNGTWECVVLEPSDGFDVIIPVRPTADNIMVTPIHPPTVESQIAEFQCEVNGVNPILWVQWKVGGVNDTSGEIISTIVNDYWTVTNTAQLSFPNTGYVEVKCTLGEGSKIWGTFTQNIAVREKAQIVDQSSDGEIQVDESFSLTCEASGHIPLISWEKDGIIINVDNPLYTITAEDTPNKQTSTLTSLAQDPTYTCDNVTIFGGSYRCVATLAEPYQDSTDISDNIDITILYSPISGPDHSQERDIGETGVVLTCEICASKILSDKWLVNGNDVADRVLQDGSLSIERITASSFGNYTRVVTNALGTGICSVVLIHKNALDVVSGLSEAEIAGIIMECLIVVAALSSSVLLAKRYQQNKQKGPKIPHIYENSTHESHDVTSQNATGLYELDEHAPTKEVSNSKAEYSELNRTGLYDNAAVHVYEVLNK